MNNEELTRLAEIEAAIDNPHYLAYLASRVSDRSTQRYINSGYVLVTIDGKKYLKRPANIDETNVRFLVGLVRELEAEVERLKQRLKDCEGGYKL